MKKKETIVNQNAPMFLKKCLRYLLSSGCGFGVYTCARYITGKASALPDNVEVIAWYRPLHDAWEYFFKFELLPLILGIVVFMILAPKQTRIDKIISWLLAIGVLFLCFYLTYEAFAYPLGGRW